MYSHLLRWDPVDLWDQGALEDPAKKTQIALCVAALGRLLKGSSQEFYHGADVTVLSFLTRWSGEPLRSAEEGKTQLD